MLGFTLIVMKSTIDLSVLDLLLLMGLRGGKSHDFIYGDYYTKRPLKALYDVDQAP